jgi:hypothetical protein
MSDVEFSRNALATGPRRNEICYSISSSDLLEE